MLELVKGNAMGQVIDLKKKTSDPRWEEAKRYYREGKYDRALKVFESLAEDDFVVAYYYVGNILEIGKGGVVQDLDGARSWYRQAIDALEDEGGAQEVVEHAYLGIARLALKGHGDAGSITDVVQYLEKRCDTNNPYALSMLGALYFDGKGVQKDLAKAAQFYERAAAQGYVLPMVHLCRLKRQNGQFLSEWYWRLKATWTAFRIRRKDPSDKRLWTFK